MWRHYPWICGLLSAPIFLGSVGPGGQAVVGILIGLSFWLLGDRIYSELPHRRFWNWFALGLLALPFIPLPASVVGWISPQHLALSRNFPLTEDGATGWLTLSLSPASSVKRVWEIGLMIVCFLLARTLAKETGGTQRLAVALGIGCIVLAGADVWCRRENQRVILGFWEVPWGTGAGTFANRNHFANWLYLSALFCLGGLLRAWQPLTTARPTKESTPPRSRLAMGFFGSVIAVSVVFGAASGSRAGAGAFLVGAIVWLILLWRRSKNYKRLLKLVMIGILGVVLALIAGENLLHRLTEVKTDFTVRYVKAEVWQQTLALTAQFPVFGIGWGAFLPVFSYYKSFGGDLTILHAENDYLETLLEVGWLGALVLGVLAVKGLRGCGRTVWQHKITEPEYALGAFAALVAFMVHALFDFVAQIPANAFLAATLLGCLCGYREQAERPAVPRLQMPLRLLSNRLAAGAVILIALLQGVSTYLWYRGESRIQVELIPAEVKRVQTALRLWPWEIKRHIVLARAQVGLMRTEPLEQQRARAESIRAELNKALVLDPYNWELRLERAWLDIAYSLDNERAQRQALETVRLNPLQSNAAGQFAAHYALTDPQFARDLLQAIPVRSAGNFAEILEVAWSIDNDTSLLWALTPDTDSGLLALGDFAIGKKLLPLAAAAYERLVGRVASEQLAERFLKAQNPARVLKLWPPTAINDAQRIFLARAYLDLQQPVEAIAILDPIFRENNWRLKLPPNEAQGDMRTLTNQWFAARQDSELAFRLINLMMDQPASQRDPVLMALVADTFPKNPQLRWAEYETRAERLEFRAAAEIALQLAQSLIR